MNYVINPSWFYWVSVFDALKYVCIGASVVIAIGGGIICGMAIADSYDDEIKEWIKRLKIVFAVSAALLCVGIFVPSEATMIKMMLAKYATYENVADAYQAILDGAKYILEGLK